MKNTIAKLMPLFALVALVAAGCGPRSPIVGTWDGEYSAGANPKEKMDRYEFNADGTFKYRMVISMAGDQVLDGEDTGRYTLTENQLVLNYENQTASVTTGGGIPNTDSGPSDKKHTYEFKWESPDRFTIKAPDAISPRGYVRKK